MKQSVQVYAPATVANAVAGFDVLGFALEAPGDLVTCRPHDKPGVHILPLEGEFASLSTNPQLNTAGVAALALLEEHGIQQGVELILQKGVPLAGGMGSSASSAAAAACAVAELFELKLSPNELLPYVLEGERAATGVIHADNAAPALFGGFTLIHGLNPHDIVPLPVPENLHAVMVHPDLQIKTKHARELLPPQVSMPVATHQMGHLAAFVTALHTEDFELMSRAMVDELAEPHRSRLIPGYAGVTTAARDAGAIGCGIAGSGPTLFALCASKHIAETVGAAMSAAFQAVQRKSETFISRISPRGASLVQAT